MRPKTLIYARYQFRCRKLIKMVNKKNVKHNSRQQYELFRRQNTDDPRNKGVLEQYGKDSSIRRRSETSYIGNNIGMG